MTINDFLIADARDQLAKMMGRPEVQAYEQRLPLSRIWAGDNRRVKHEIMGLASSSIEAVENFQAYLFQGVPPPYEAELAVKWHLKSLRAQGIDPASLPTFAQESAFAPETTLVVAEERRYRPDFFRHLGTIIRFRQAISGAPIRRVLELGAGTGNLARLFVHYFPGVRYVIIDLPDTLIYSFMYLRLNFPEARCRFIESAAPLSESDIDAYDFLFCPVGLEEAFSGLQFDACVNTASLGEMRAEAVRYWFNFFQNRLSALHILSVNRFLNTIRPGEHSWRIDENTSALCFDRDWEVLDWELDPTFLRCPYVNKAARQLLVIARRNANLDAGECRRRSIELLKEADCGSWNKPPLEMTCQDNVLVADMTVMGILFRLWESLRLDARADNTLSMLKYLTTLTHGRDTSFEETYQYEERLSGFQSGVGFSSQGTVASKKPPMLVAAASEYNVVFYCDVYFAVPRALGPVDLQSTDPISLPGVLMAHSIAALRVQLGPAIEWEFH